jgi:hypothetical protein
MFGEIAELAAGDRTAPAKIRTITWALGASQLGSNYRHCRN